MSILITKNCHYAILVAIEDGRNFTAQDDKDIYIASRLNLSLPRPVDDLIPPTTLISTKPTILTEQPQWRTTLAYYVSTRILHRLRKREAEITLEVNTLAVKGERDKLGSMVLRMKDAKMVVLHGKRDIAQIQQFVVDKGDWLNINENGVSKVKTGLFIVEMPHNTDAVDKKFGTPLQMPVRTNNSNDVGLEICSDISVLLANSMGDDNSLLMNAEDDEDEYEQQLLQHEDEDEYDEQAGEDDEEEEEEEQEHTIAIGEGLDQYSFVFQIIDAKHISSITNGLPDDVQAFFQYEFANKQYRCSVEYKSDQWRTLEHHHNIYIQGNLEDIKAWMAELSTITICLIIEDSSGKQDLIGYSEVYIKGRDIGVFEQSALIYDCDKTWHINSDKQFSKLRLQFGLTEGWIDDSEGFHE